MRYAAWMLFLALMPGFALAADEPRLGIPPGERFEKVLTAQELPGETRDWALANLNVPPAWKTTEGKGVVVAVLDTGVMRNHRDLRDQILEVKDFTNSASGGDDRNGHGTWCAGAIAAADNGWGMIGAAPKVKLLILKVLNDQGSGSVVGIAAAIRYATDWVGPNGERVAVISMSLGGPGRDSYLPPAIDYARSKGLTVVAAAGNDGPRENTVGYPGGYPGVIAVAAHDKTGATAQFSSRGPAVFATGPGVETRAPYPGQGDGHFASNSGTSMSTPYLAAIVALCLAAHPEIPVAERPTRIPELLRTACSHPATRTTKDGYGKPDAVKLVTGGSGPVDPPAPKPITVTLTEADLVPAAIARLKAAGVETFSLVVSGRPAAPPQPMPKGLSYRELYDRVQAGESVRIAFGVAAPVGAVELLTEGVPTGTPPGVYRCERSGVGMRWRAELTTIVSPPPPRLVLPGTLFGGCPGGVCPRR